MDGWMDGWVWQSVLRWHVVRSAAASLDRDAWMAALIQACGRGWVTDGLFWVSGRHVVRSATGSLLPDASQHVVRSAAGSLDRDSWMAALISCSRLAQ
ncbi:hypothetical protein T484DRAFT_1918789 [Baffinella frigidus]|nr:hypothetical protein T484DRAFT_1918789 [Cryptophyta sp. CCMP2293]